MKKRRGGGANSHDESFPRYSPEQVVTVKWQKIEKNNYSLYDRLHFPAQRWGGGGGATPAALYKSAYFNNVSGSSVDSVAKNLFFFSPVHLSAVTYITEISLTVT